MNISKLVGDINLIFTEDYVNVSSTLSVKVNDWWLFIEKSTETQENAIDK